MIRLDQQVPLILSAGAVNVILQLLAEAPYRVVAPIVDTIRAQVIAIDPTAFDPPDAAAPLARVNGAGSAD